MTIPPERRSSSLTAYVPLVCYLALIAVIGLLTGTGIAPDTLQVALPWWLVQIWTVSIAFGGISCTVGAASKATSLESAGLLLLAWGAFLYGSVIAVVGYPYSFGAAAVSAAVILTCVIRLRELAHIRRQAREHKLAEKVQVHGEL